MERVFTIIPNEQTPKTPQIRGVKKFIEKNKEELEAFLEFAKANGDRAVGLAANQCALNGKRFNKRAFAIKNDDGDWALLINPKIESKKGNPTMREEGCLTWLGKKIQAVRFPIVHVSFYDLRGDKHEITAETFRAQIYQHEIAHLDGEYENVVEVTASQIAAPKIGRNSPCHCGSGKKFKKCCL